MLKILTFSLFFFKKEKQFFYYKTSRNKVSLLLLVGLVVTNLGSRLELARLESLDSTLVTTSVSVGESGVGLKLTRLEGKDGTLVDTSISRGKSNLTLELARLNSFIITEGKHLELSSSVTLVSTSETTDFLRSRQSLDNQERIGNLGVLLLRSASGAPNLTRVLLEGL